MLKSLFSRKALSSSPAVGPSQGLKEIIKKQLVPRGLSPLPGNARIMFELATNPKTELKDIVPLIQQDESMTARILKVANSAYFNRGKPVQTIHEAITTVGLVEICSILSCASLNDIFPSSSPLRRTLWRHNLTTAIVARAIAQKYTTADSSLLFTAGLLHDIGKLLLLQKFSNLYEKMAEKNLYSSQDTTLIEMEEFPFNHADVGCFIAEKWNFPAAIILPIAAHHSPWENLTKGDSPHIIKLADVIAHTLENDFGKRNQASQGKINSELKIGLSCYNSGTDPASLLKELRLRVYEEIETFG
jgi:putative nucleotidyltransferase with HDIG domain